MSRYGMRALIAYRGSITETGEVFDEHGVDHPFIFTVGAGSIPIGLEKAIADMEVGEERTVDIPSALAFGEYDEDAFRKVPTYMIPNADKLPIGQFIELRSKDSASTAHAKVVDVVNEVAYIDLNHPLAGKDCTFWVKLISLD